MKTILVWDIENIPINKASEIFKKIKEKPDAAYAISKKDIPDSALKELEYYGVKHIQSKDRIADDEIVELLIHSLDDFDKFIIISSDADFCFFVDMAKGKKIEWILNLENGATVVKQNKSKGVKHIYLSQKAKDNIKTENLITPPTPKIIVPRRKEITKIEIKEKFIEEPKIDVQIRTISEIYGVSIEQLNFLKIYKESEPKVITEKTQFKLAMQRKRLKFVLRETIKRIIYFQTEVKEGFCDCCETTTIVHQGICKPCEVKFLGKSKNFELNDYLKREFKFPNFKSNREIKEAKQRKEI